MLTLNAPRKKRASPNPLRMDPTRTASLRRAFERQLTMRFLRLKEKLRALLLDEDALGLLPDPLLHPTLGGMRVVNCGGEGGTPGPCPSGRLESAERMTASIVSTIDKLGGDPQVINSGMCFRVAEGLAAQLGDGAKALGNGFHGFVEYKGRYYDVEAPNGVSSPKDLPFFKRAPKSWNTARFPIEVLPPKPFAWNKK